METVNDIIFMLADLVDKGADVHFHFIPSHTEEEKGGSQAGIGRSEDIDALAKSAAFDTLPAHDAGYKPPMSAYRQILKRIEQANLQEYLNNQVKESHWPNYPHRQSFIDDYTHRSKNDVPTQPCLFRARCGHNASRHHLHNVGIESDNTCRHCHHKPETVKHQLLDCNALDLEEERDIFNALPLIESTGMPPTFETSLWTHPRKMTTILKSAKARGLNIKPNRLETSLPYT
jgi:hypothetical protein